MKERSLTQPVEQLALADHKIAFVSGPRQCGKTTLAKMLLRKRKVGLYRNWDEIEFRRAWAKTPSATHAVGDMRILVAGAGEALHYLA
jgi:predicted AAA+ superfamily ATPase